MVYTSDQTSGKRFHRVYCIGVIFALLGLGGVAGILYYFLGHKTAPEDQEVKVSTPVGEDYFSVRFVSSAGSSGAYCIKALVGTNPPSENEILLDTGSADTWFEDDSGFMQKSDSYINYPDFSYIIRYMGGSVEGNLGNDLIDVNTFDWTQNIGVVTDVNKDIDGKPNMDMGALDGIMGVCRGGCDSRKLCVMNNWALKESAIGFYYDPMTWAGLFMAGFINETMYCEPGEKLTWIENTGNYFWTGAVGMSVKGKTIGNNLSAIFDTGTTYLMLKQSLYTDMMNKLGTDCTGAEITLNLGGKDFTIPSDVIVRRSSPCVLRASVLPEKSLHADILVGAVFLVNFYSVFHLRDEKWVFV